MPSLVFPKDCTGCAACDNVCPKDAVEMVADERGFLHPDISPEKCVECKLCEKHCPVTSCLEVDEAFRPKVFAAWHKSKAIRLDSSSGGAFSALAEAIICEGGGVYGAAWNDARNVSHRRIDTITELSELRKSKYIPSTIAKTFREVKRDLQAGRKVLFAGTPCQVAGLKSFLQKINTAGLMTVDFICHGVPSPAVYNKYIDSLEKHYGRKVQSVNFRDKKLGVETNLILKVTLSDGESKDIMFDKNSFYRGFVENVYLRTSCYNCRFNKFPRIADISLADFRGLGEKRPFSKIKERYLGFTGIIINTSKGELLVRQSPNLMFEERPETELYNSQPHLNHPANKPLLSDSFWDEFNVMSYDDLASKYLPMSLKNRLMNMTRFILRPRLYYAVVRVAKKLIKH